MKMIETLFYKSKRYCLGLFFTLIIAIQVYGHSGFASHLMWTTASSFGLYSSKDKTILPSFDVNSAFCYINSGLGYKNAENISWDNLSVYLGSGIGNFIQLQAGFSKGGFSIRNRYDIPLGYIFWDLEFPEICPYISLTTVSASIEKYFSNSQRNWFFGLGIGFSIHNFFGIKAFKDGVY